MQISTIISGLLQQPESINGSNRKAQQEAESPPYSWGSDTVSISAEARAAAAQAAGQESEEDNGESGASKASEDFSAYMTKKRSKVQSGSSQDRLEALRSQLESLQSQVVQVASSDKSGAEKSSRMETLNSQIRAVEMQIDELSGAAAEEQQSAQQG